ncbi:MAG: DoxX family membrane protein [Phycisphaerae bacterium]
MDLMRLDARRFFVFGMRLFFGVWLLYAGVSKWIMFGAKGFVGFIATDFDKTWSPHALNVVLAWVILVAEPALALFVLSGRYARVAWALTALLMFMLTLGQTLLMKADVASNWQYLIMTLVCAALSDPTPGPNATPGGRAEPR